MTSPRTGVRLALLFVFAPGILLVAMLWITGVPPLTSLLLTLLVAWQALGGVIVWRSVRPESSPLELLGMGLAIGTAMAAMAGLLTSTVGWGPWGSLVPAAGAVCFGFLRRKKHRSYLTMGVRGEIPAYVATILIGLGAFLYALRSYPLTWIGTWTGYHPDMAFFEALANSLARFGAFESPFMSGGVVRYHWLSYAWTGQLSVLTDAAPFVGITRVLPLVALLGSAAIVVAWTRRMSGSTWTPFLAGALLTLSGFVGAVFGGILTLDSPSQAMSTLWLLAFTVAIIHAFNTSTQRATYPLIALLAASITIGKVSAAAPALAGVLLAAVALRARKNISTRHATTIVLVSALAIGIAFAAFIAGAAGGGGLQIGSLLDRSSSQQGLNPLDGPRGVVVGTLILVLAIIPRWAGVIQLVVNHTWRWRPETWMSIGMAASSLLALIAFNSFNELWFSVSASGPLAATSAVGVGLAVSSLQSRGRPPSWQILTIATLTAIAIFAAASWTWATGASGGNLFIPTQRWLGPLIGVAAAILAGALLSIWGTHRITSRAIIAGALTLLVFSAVLGRLLGAGSDQIGFLENGTRNEWFNVNREGQAQSLDTITTTDWSGKQMETAAWLRENAKPTDLLATNFTLSPFVAAATHLPTYVSAIQYQYAYGTSDMRLQLLEKESDVWAFIKDPSPENLRPLCEAGVRWIWVDPARTEPTDWSPFAKTTIEAPTDSVLAIDPDACGPFDE